MPSPWRSYRCFDYKLGVGLWIFNVCVDVFFILDIVLNFRTAFAEEKMMSLVVDPKLIARNYILGRHHWGGWFWFDLLAAIPFDWIPNDKTGGVLSFAKLGRLFRLTRLTQKFEHFTAAHIMRVSNVLVLLLICTHCMACIWWSVGWSISDDRGWQFTSKAASVLLETDVSNLGDPFLINSLSDGEIVYNATRLREAIESVSLPKK